MTAFFSRSPPPARQALREYHAANEIIRMRIRDLDAGEGREVFREQLDAVVDEQAAVDFGSLAGDAAFQQVLGLVADAGDQRLERRADLRLVAAAGDLLLQLHQLVAAALGGLARRYVL